jgi:flagellar basal-body rod modification protein FlgD
VHASLMQMLQSATQPPVKPYSAASPASTSASTSSSTSTDPGVDLTQTFLQLLTTQLKNQSPLDPVDPNQFVVQLAQFDSLGELTQIQELMQTLVNDVAPQTSPGSGSSANASSTTSPSVNTSSH